VKLAIFGATGATGRLVLQQALDRGDEVVALVRNARGIDVKHQRLRVIEGSAVSAADVEACVAGSDVVVHCLGIGGKGDGRKTTLISDSVALALTAMKKHRVPRIVTMSNIGAGGSSTWFANRLVIPVFLRWLQPIIEDKDRMEASLHESGLEWISVRLPSIVDGPKKAIRHSLNGRSLSLSITAASAADFLIEQTRSIAFLHSAPSISN
jgi:putative NADH-flavin reductase